MPFVLVVPLIVMGIWAAWMGGSFLADPAPSTRVFGVALIVAGISDVLIMLSL